MHTFRITISFLLQIGCNTGILNIDVRHKNARIITSHNYRWSQHSFLIKIITKPFFQMMLFAFTIKTDSSVARQQDFQGDTFLGNLVEHQLLNMI